MHRQLKLLICSRCRALTQGEILPAVVEGRLRAADGGDDENGERPASGVGITTPEELREELKQLRDRKVLAVLLVDVTDVTGSFLPRVRDLVGGNPIVLIATKSDLLPKGTDDSHILDWLADRLSPRLNVVDLHLVSSRTGDGVRAAMRAVMTERSGRDVVVLGAANVGKSLFVGAFLEHAFDGMRLKRLPISSATPGTTLRLIGIDCFDGGSMLFDTPGVHLAHRVSAVLLPEELKAILPRGRITPYTPRAAPSPGTSFFWGGLVRIDAVEAPPSARLTFVSAYRLQVSALADVDGEGATRHYEAEVGRTLTPPLNPASAAELGGLELRERVELELVSMEQTADITISGLGWVSVGALASLRRSPSMRAVFDVWVPRGVQVSVRPPMPTAGLANPVVLPE